MKKRSNKYFFCTQNLSLGLGGSGSVHDPSHKSNSHFFLLSFTLKKTMVRRYIRTPRLESRQGFVSTGTAKIHCSSTPINLLRLTTAAGDSLFAFTVAILLSWCDSSSPTHRWPFSSASYPCLTLHTSLLQPLQTSSSTPHQASRSQLQKDDECLKLSEIVRCHFNDGEQ